MLTADRYIPMSMIEALRADTHRPMTPTHASSCRKSWTAGASSTGSTGPSPQHRCSGTADLLSMGTVGPSCAPPANGVRNRLA